MSLPKRDAAASSSGTPRQLVLQNPLTLLFLAAVTALLVSCGGGSDAPPAAAPPAAAITAQPTDQSEVAASTATFSVTATNATGYQWQRSAATGATFSDVLGATAASHTTAATTPADSGVQYRVVVSGAGGSVTSSAATLTVTAAVVAPAITLQPAPQTITTGQNARFTVAASGSPTPTYQWQLSTDNGANFSNIAGATNAIFEVISAAQVNNRRQFRAVATNSAGSVTSNAATLTVNAAPPARATALVSVSLSGVAANNISGFPSMSADGKLVAFTSIGTDLVAGFSATDHGYAYLRNLTTGVTSVINQTPSGTRSSQGVGKVKLAAGGYHAVFTSVAGDLVAGVANSSLDVYLRNLQTGTTTQLNLLPDGTEINQAGSPSNDLRLSISADGRWVTFISGYDLLGNGAPLPYTALFLRDTANNVTRLIASDSASQTMGVPAISNDGRYVVYALTNFTANTYGLLRYDTQSGLTASLFTDAHDANSYVDPRRLSLSDDGRYVSFSMRSATLLGGAAAAHPQVVVLDSTLPTTDTARLTIASTGASGAGDGRSQFPVISGDGRYVIFNTFSPSLTGDPAATIRTYVMVRDRTLGTTQVASRRVDGSNVWVPQNEAHHNLSADGTALMFVADVAEMRMPFTAGGEQVFAAPRP